MVRHDLKSMPTDELWSLQQLADADREQSVSLVSKFRAQQQRTQQLDAYFNQAVAEIRASLDRTPDKGS
jgi:type II secretory pathway component PulL